MAQGPITYNDVMKWLGKEFLQLPPTETRALIQELNRNIKLKKALSVANFTIGDTVVFQGKRGQKIRGVVTRGNRSTLNVTADDGTPWRVSPALAQKIA